MLYIAKARHCFLIMKGEQWFELNFIKILCHQKFTSCASSKETMLTAADNKLGPSVMRSAQEMPLVIESKDKNVKNTEYAKDPQNNLLFF